MRNKSAAASVAIRAPWAMCYNGSRSDLTEPKQETSDMHVIATWLSAWTTSAYCATTAWQSISSCF